MRKITKELVVDGIKFIAEHQSLDYGDLATGLKGLGCDFSFEEIKAQFPKTGKTSLRDGIREGDIVCGAFIIANVMNSNFGRLYCKDRLLSVDNDASLYYFIRKVTGDESYTKSVIDK